MVKQIDFTKSHTLVIGDIMLDRYYFGDVERVSPEAPVPVVKVASVRDNLGGAGNVACNIACLGANSFVIGAVGEDQEGAVISRLLEDLGVDSSLIAVEAPSIMKARVIGNSQQVVRLDFEESYCAAPHIFQGVVEAVEAYIDKATSIVISDYDKGLCSEEICRYVIERAKRARIPVVVDPKGVNWEKYRGATVVTPNMKELSALLNCKIDNSDEAVEHHGMSVLNRFGFEHLLVTRSEKGMSLLAADRCLHKPTVAKEVYDVSGAGDTVVGSLAASMGVGYGIEDSMDIAGRCASVVVSKVGTSPVLYHELLETYGKEVTPGLLSKDMMKLLRNELGRRQKRVVFTNGCFDILHKGHVYCLEEASKLGDVLIVGINSDASVKRLKGLARPVNNERDRANVLLGLGAVDYVVIFDEDTPEELLSVLLPDVMVKGGDYKVEDVLGREFAHKTVIVNYLDGYSTTSIIDKV